MSLSCCHAVSLFKSYRYLISNSKHGIFWEADVIYIFLKNAAHDEKYVNVFLFIYNVYFSAYRLHHCVSSSISYFCMWRSLFVFTWMSMFYNTCLQIKKTKKLIFIVTEWWTLLFFSVYVGQDESYTWSHSVKCVFNVLLTKECIQLTPFYKYC